MQTFALTYVNNKVKEIFVTTQFTTLAEASVVN